MAQVMVSTLRAMAMTAMDEGIAIMDPTREAIIYSGAHGPLYDITAMTMDAAGINEDFKQNFVLD